MPRDAPSPSIDAYRERRARLAKRLGEGALVLYGGDLRTRSNDTEFRFRPDSNFYYLTGLAEPGAVLVFRPASEAPLTLFVRPRDADAEVWSGRRIGPEGAQERFAADQAFDLAELDAELGKLIDGADVLHVPLGLYPHFDRRILATLQNLRRRDRYGDKAPELIRDARETIGEDRIVKDAAALTSLRHAAEVTIDAHIAAMRAARPGMYEYEIEALIEYEFRRRGCSGPGYGSIVGSGDNATILHYVDNEGPLSGGDLLLIDAGAEWNLFSADLTRTFPVSGAFTPAQRDLYEVVLCANEAGIAATMVGNDIDAIHRQSIRILCEGMIDIGLLAGGIDEILETEAYKRYYMHRTSHWLGADVHDAGYYCIERKPRALVPGFVLTVEPGLYVAAADEDAPAPLRGCGIRIEDDVLVTDAGPEVLTERAPKSVAELEALIGS